MEEENIIEKDCREYIECIKHSFKLLMHSIEDEDENGIIIYDYLKSSENEEIK